MKTTMNTQLKKYLTLSNLITALLVVFIAAMLFFPQVKAGVIRGLMTIGLFQPKTPPLNGENTALIPAPSFSITDINHQSIDVADQKGKVLFINFWATWCPPCIAEMPSINTLYQQFKEDPNVQFLLIDVDSQPQRSMDFMNKNNWALPVYIPNQNIHPDYFTGTLPTTVIVNKKGQITFKHSGAGDFSNKKIRDYIKILSEQ